MASYIGLELRKRLKHWQFKLWFSPTDFWVGFYVKQNESGSIRSYWLCLVPMFPLQVRRIGR